MHDVRLLHLEQRAHRLPDLRRRHARRRRLGLVPRRERRDHRRGRGLPHADRLRRDLLVVRRRPLVASSCSRSCSRAPPASARPRRHRAGQPEPQEPRWSPRRSPRCASCTARRSCSSPRRSSKRSGRRSPRCRFNVKIAVGVAGWVAAARLLPLRRTRAVQPAEHRHRAAPALAVGGDGPRPHHAAALVAPGVRCRTCWSLVPLMAAAMLLLGWALERAMGRDAPRLVAEAALRPRGAARALARGVRRSCRRTRAVLARWRRVARHRACSCALTRRCASTSRARSTCRCASSRASAAARRASAAAVLGRRVAQLRGVADARVRALRGRAAHGLVRRALPSCFLPAQGRARAREHRRSLLAGIGECCSVLQLRGRDRLRARGARCSSRSTSPPASRSTSTAARCSKAGTSRSPCDASPQRHAAALLFMCCAFSAFAVPRQPHTRRRRIRSRRSPRS